MKLCEQAGCGNRARIQDNKGRRGRLCETHHRLRYPKRSGYIHRHKRTERKSARNSNFMREYGISLETRNRLVTNQAGNCAICGDRVGEALHIDHCHKTGKVRGMLCFKCNNGLGSFNDSIDLLASAASYLINSRLKETG